MRGRAQPDGLPDRELQHCGDAARAWVNWVYVPIFVQKKKKPHRRECRKKEESDLRTHMHTHLVADSPSFMSSTLKNMRVAFKYMVVEEVK